MVILELSGLSYGHFYATLCLCHRNLAYFYAVKKDEEHTLQHLAQARDCALAFINLDRKAEHSSLLLRGMEYGDFYNAVDENDADWVLEDMEEKVFDFLRENGVFKEIRRSLQEYAGGWWKK